jgi:hypothetical protein
MTQKHINFGAYPNDINADAIRTAFTKVEDNFTQLFTGQTLAGVTQLTAGPGLHPSVANKVTGAIQLNANIANINILSHTLKAGINSNIGSSAIITDTANVLVLDLPDSITTDTLTANAVNAPIANLTTLTTSNATINNLHANTISAPVANIVALTANTATANVLVSTIANGTAPLIVTSKTLVANLNVANANVAAFANLAANANFATLAATANVAFYAEDANAAAYADYANTANFATYSGTAFEAIASENIMAGLPNQLVYQTASDATSFIDAPTTAATVLTWTGSSFVWAAPGTSTATSALYANTANTANYASVAANATYSNYSGNANFSNSAALANYVTANNQANINQLGTLTRLDVTGNVNLGSVSNVHITGGSTGSMIITDGYGNLAWAPQAGTVAAGPFGAVQFNGAGNSMAGEDDEYFLYNPIDHDLLMNDASGGITLSYAGIVTSNTDVQVTGTGKFATTNWSITEVAGKLVFSYGGVAKASLDSNGNFIAANNVTGGGTP